MSAVCSAPTKPRLQANDVRKTRLFSTAASVSPVKRMASITIWRLPSAVAASKIKKMTKKLIHVSLLVTTAILTINYGSSTLSKVVLDSSKRLKRQKRWNMSWCVRTRALTTTKWRNNVVFVRKKAANTSTTTRPSASRVKASTKLTTTPELAPKRS